MPIDTDKSSAGTIKWSDDATIDNPKWVFEPTNPQYYNTEILYGVAEVEKNHNFDDDHHVEGAEATCTTGGNHEYWQCTVCEKYFGDEDGTEELTSDQFSIAALGHNMSEVEAVAATCTEGGNYKYYSCSRCNGLFWDNAGDSACTAAEVVQTALNHDYTDTVVAATCTAQGYTEHTCSRTGCGNTYKDTYTAMSPHAWDDGEVTTAATCTATGVMTYTCDTCGNTKTE
ncbi:MAG: hypothetical protein K2O67_03345, partial [Clostridia bacterium]|nr:hypothetical protein [Clostridia bacterium]